MEANEPEKKMPSTAAKAMILSPKVAVVEPIHCRAHSAFFLTQGTASKHNSLCEYHSTHMKVAEHKNDLVSHCKDRVEHTF